jgi:hypothetical protein
MIAKLREFVINHTVKVTLGAGDVDIEFFGVKVIEEPSKEELLELVTNSKEGEFGTSFDLFDGEEHSYLNLGGWIGDQGLAMQLMALGKYLAIWDLMTPTTMLPMMPLELRQKMAGSGMITIKKLAVESVNEG